MGCLDTFYNRLKGLYCVCSCYDRTTHLWLKCFNLQQSGELVTGGMQSSGRILKHSLEAETSRGRINLIGWVNCQRAGNLFCSKEKQKRQEETKMTPSSELDPIKIITTSRAALPLRKCLNNCDSIRGKWCTDGRMGAEMRSVALWSGSGVGGGVDVQYPPAGTAPVRLLVEAEASPAFLRRARVWAQCTACTKQGGGKATKKKKKEKRKTKRSGRGGKKGVRGGETKKDRKKETQELVRAGETTNGAVRSEKSHQVKLLVAGYSTAKHQ